MSWPLDAVFCLLAGLGIGLSLGYHLAELRCSRRRQREWAEISRQVDAALAAIQGRPQPARRREHDDG